nr:hypothetical protein GCM10020093_060430 [Planobispora longispora]
MAALRLLPERGQLGGADEHGRAPLGLGDDAVGEPVHVADLDPLAHDLVLDQQVELGGEVGDQPLGEGDEQDRARAAPGQVGRAVQSDEGLAVPAPPVTRTGRS